MKLVRRNLGNILISICELLAGILLLIDPERYTRVLIIIIGIVLVVFGVLNVVRHLRIPPLEASRSYRMSWGLILTAGGIFCIVDAGWFINVFPVLTLYGVALIAIGFIKIQWTVDMLRIGDTRWYCALISVAMAFVVAIVLLVNSTSDSRVMWIITGIILIFSAVLDIVTLFFRFMRQEEVAKEYKDDDRRPEKRRKNNKNNTDRTAEADTEEADAEAASGAESDSAAMPTLDADESAETPDDPADAAPDQPAE